VNLPSSLVTVTPFSKVVALLLFVSLTVGAFFFGAWYQSQIPVTTTSNQPATTSAKKNICPSIAEVSFTPEDSGKVLNVKPGILVTFNYANYQNYDWGAQASDTSDSSVLSAYTGPCSPAHSLVFSTLKPGKVELSLVGSPTCAKTTPRCLAPDRLVNATINVSSN
jgi:hypothetical protein